MDDKKVEKLEGTPDGKTPEVDPAIAEIQKDPNAVAALLKAKRDANAEATAYRFKLDALDKKKQDDEKKALEDQGKFKDLAEKEKGEKTELMKKFSERAVLSELRTEALKAGILDTDAVILADKSGIKVDENFGISGAAEAIAALKKSKPFLFKAADESTTPAPGTPNPPLKTTLINPHKEGESVLDRITRGLESPKKK
jgi:hypothetical protein